MSNRILIYLVFSFLIIGSCKQEDLINDLNSPNSDLTLEEAKSFFENKFLSRKVIEKIASNDPLSHVHDETCNVNHNQAPMWDGFGYRTLTSGNQAVLVPLHRRGVYVQVSDTSKVSYGYLNYFDVS